MNSANVGGATPTWAAPLAQHLVDDLEQPRRALSGQRGNVHDRRKVQEFQIEPQPVVELLRKILPFPLHQIPFVHGNHHAPSGPLGFARDCAVLIRRAELGINDEHHDVGVGNGAFGCQHADGLDSTRSRHASRLPDTGRIDDSELTLAPAETRVHGIPSGAGQIADEHALFTQHAVHERRLPDIRTPDDGDAGLGGLGLLFFGPGRQAFDDLVEQIADALTVFAGDLQNRIEAQLVEVDRSAPRAPIVGLVHGDDHGHPARSQRVGDVAISGHQPLAAVDDKNHQVGGIERALASLDLADADVAPDIDWEEAMRRTRDIDGRAS
jgi:hypothetical protein